ncbi:DUF4261 domain-containing protein [Salana multivorans]
MVSLAFLLMDQDPKLAAQDVVDQLHTDWPDLTVHLEAAAQEAPTPDGPTPDGPIVLDVGGSLVALMSVPGPLGDDLAEIAQHSRLWPSDRNAPTDASHHLIVSVFSQGSQGDRGHTGAIADAVLLSQVVASLVGLGDAVKAVYLGSAGHLIAPETFRTLAAEVLPRPLVLAWVALNVGARQDGTITGHTRGMDMLGLLNLEIPETPEDASTTLDRLASIADYLVQNGPVIGDGDTIGSTPVAEIVAHHVPSVFDPEETVIRLSFGFVDPQPQGTKGFFSKFRRS